jgi:GTP cyclohydrolase I
VLTDWPGYLASWINDLVPGSAQQVMYAVGVMEIVAGVAVAFADLLRLLRRGAARGVKATGSRTVTSALHGMLSESPGSRQDFFSLTGLSA